MVFVQCFLAALAIIDVDGALQVFYFQVAEGLLTEVVERAVGRDGLAADGLQLFALQMVRRRRGVDGVEVPRGGRDIDARAVRHTVFVNPQLVLVGCQPGGVAAKGVALYEDGWRRSLVPHLEGDAVLAGRNGKGVAHGIQLAVQCQVVAPLGGNGDGFLAVQGKRLGELDGGVVGVLLPERRKHSATLGATIVKDVAQPHLEVAGVPYPCCFCSLLHIHVLLYMIRRSSGGFVICSGHKEWGSRRMLAATAPTREGIKSTDG